MGYKTISTQGTMRYDDENGSIKKKLENRNPFCPNPIIDIDNNNKKLNDMRRISIDNSSKNKNRLRENLNYYGYNVLVTSGNDIISENKKNKEINSVFIILIYLLIIYLQNLLIYFIQ